MSLILQYTDPRNNILAFISKYKTLDKYILNNKIKNYFNQWYFDVNLIAKS